MTEEKKELKARAPFKIVSQDPLTLEGTFRKGMKLGDVVHKTFRMREATTDDMLNAEADGHVANSPLAYEIALAALQLESVGDFKGAITIELVRERVKPLDIARLRACQGELDRLLGED